MYSLIIVAILAFLFGFWLHYRAINWLIRQGTIDVYRDGYKLEEFRMW